MASHFLKLNIFFCCLRFGYFLYARFQRAIVCFLARRRRRHRGLRQQNQLGKISLFGVHSWLINLCVLCELCGLSHFY